MKKKLMLVIIAGAAALALNLESANAQIFRCGFAWRPFAAQRCQQANGYRYTTATNCANGACARQYQYQAGGSYWYQANRAARSCYGGACYTGGCQNNACPTAKNAAPACANGVCAIGSDSGANCANGSCAVPVPGEYKPVRNADGEVVKQYVKAKTTGKACNVCSLLQRVNAARARYGLAALANDANLESGSYYQASYCSRIGGLQHGAGVAEILAQNSQGIETAINQWLNSPAHRALLLNGGFRYAGVAVVRDSYGRVWCAVRFR